MQRLGLFFAVPVSQFWSNKKTSYYPNQKAPYPTGVIFAPGLGTNALQDGVVRFDSRLVDATAPRVLQRRIFYTRWAK